MKLTEAVLGTLGLFAVLLVACALNLAYHREEPEQVTAQQDDGIKFGDTREAVVRKMGVPPDFTEQINGQDVLEWRGENGDVVIKIAMQPNVRWGSVKNPLHGWELLTGL